MIASASDPSLRLRLPAPLMERVKKSAKANGRSFNSEVLVRLADSVATKKKL